MNAFEFLPTICKKFNAYNVHYVVIGGCAINLHGFLRPTVDIDFLIELSEDNVEKIKNALNDMLPEINELSIDLIKKYIPHGVIRLGMGENFYIDLISKVGDLDYEKVKDNVEIATIERIKIPYASLDDMIKLKSRYREINQRDRLFLIGKKEYLEKHKK